MGSQKCVVCLVINFRVEVSSLNFFVDLVVNVYFPFVIILGQDAGPYPYGES